MSGNSLYSEALDSGTKRTKGIGIGAPEGPISLADFRSLQRSNKVGLVYGSVNEAELTYEMQL